MSDAQLSAARLRYCALAAFENAYAVKTQVKRLQTFDRRDPWIEAQRTADAQFLIIAMWRLRQAAVMCDAERPGVAGKALETFDAGLPALKELRNVLMHYDEYVQGTDKRRTRAAGSEHYVSLRDVQSMFSMPDGFSWLGHTYAYEAVLDASTALYTAVIDVTGPPQW